MHKLFDNIKPRVSVVCLCYNQVNFIETSIQGFINQKTKFPFEIIIGDDCSNDGTIEIIQNYYKNNVNIIKPIFRNNNIGGAKNLINCLDIAVGDYIAYCEGDDFWNDDKKLQKQFDLLESNLEFGLIWTDIDVNDLQKGKVFNSVFQNKFYPKYDNFEDILINKPFFAPSTWFFRKDFKLFFNNYINYIDGSFPFILDIIKSSRIFYMNEVTGVYTKRFESASNNINPLKRYEFARLVFKIQIEYSYKYKVSNDIVHKIYFNYYNSFLHYAIIAKDYNFLKDADKILINSKNKRVLFLLFISKFKPLIIIFAYIFKKDKYIILFKSFSKCFKFFILFISMT